MKPYAIFDFDGTLVDSMSLWTSLGEKYLQTKGIQPPATLQSMLQTMTLQQSAQYMIETFCLSQSVEQVMQEMNQLIQYQYFYEVPLKPGVESLLKFLHKENVKMCIVTASEQSHVQATLKRLQIDVYFDFIVTCTEVGLDKNQPDIYLLAAERWGALANEVMVFEDALNAIQSAKKGDFYTIGVYDSSVGSEQEMCKKSSDLYLTDFSKWGDYL